MLSGALTHPDISWQSITHFGQEFGIVVPAYPPVHTMDELCDGIAAILRREGIESAHVMGGSYGGFVAQVFVRRFPAVCRSLVLSHTSAPDSTGIEKARRMMGWLPVLPAVVLRRILGGMLGRLMPADASSPSAQLMLALFHEVMDHHLTKADFLAISARTLDFYGRAFSLSDLSGWPGRILLALAEDDPASPERVRSALQSLYPHAALHLFRGSGHAAAITNAEEYQGVVDEFLRAQI